MWRAASTPERGPAIIGSLAEVPFEEKEPDVLLGISPGRASIDTAHEGFGWGRVPRLVLEDDAGGTRALEDALVIALHVADEDGTAPDDDPDIELRVGDEVLLARLSAFLRVWAPRLQACPAWVLALCNPRRRTIARAPAIPSGTMLWYALGDVDSWAEEGDEIEGPTYGLTAHAWRRA